MRRGLRHGADYGAVQGAVEAGEDPAEVAVQAVKAAREMAPEMGVAAEHAGLYGFIDCFPAVRLLYALSPQQECPTCSFP